MLDSFLLGALNHLLDGAPWARARLAPFAGRQVRFDIPPLAIAFAITTDGRLTAGLAASDDVVVRLPAVTPLRLLEGWEQLMGQASVEGNAEFATELSFVLRNLRWDAEEDLSGLVGDIAAHRLVAGATRWLDWQRQAATRLAENLREYLTEENPVLVSRAELQDFSAVVERLRQTLAQVETRLTALERNSAFVVR